MTLDTPSTFVGVTDYLALPRAPEEWVIQDILPAGGLLNIYGRPKTGKSFLALQLAAAIADPRVSSVLSLPVYTHGPVAYLQVDTARGTWASRIENNFRTAGIACQDIFLADAGCVPYPFNILHDGKHWLRAACDALKPVCVVIDTIREIHRGDENDSAHLQNAVACMIEATSPAAIIVLSHSRKNKPDDSSDDLMAENRGSNYLAGRSDCILRVSSETRIDYQGRSVDKTSVNVTRDEFGLFHSMDPSGVVADRLMRDMRGASQADIVRALREAMPSLSTTAARGIVRRREDAQRREGTE